LYTQYYFSIFRLHTGRCGPGPRQAVWQRLLPDHHLQVRGSQPLLQEHVQAQAAARQVAGGRGHLANCACPAPSRSHHVFLLLILERRIGGGGRRRFAHRRTGGAGAPPQETHQHRQHHPGGAGTSLQQQSQADKRGGAVHQRWIMHGEGGGESLVLQPASEGEAVESQRRSFAVQLAYS